jgi:hypothetical protein
VVSFFVRLLECCAAVCVESDHADCQCYASVRAGCDSSTASIFAAQRRMEEPRVSGLFVGYELTVYLALVNDSLV